jgi:hypothetical protein
MNMTGDDVTTLHTAKIKIVNVFEESTACSSEELVLFITLTSFITQQTTVKVQFFPCVKSEIIAPTRKTY